MTLSPPLFTKIDCHSMPVDDLDKAIAFYSRLGHELLWRDERAAGFRLGNAEAELVVHTDREFAETDFMVDSVPEAVEQFVAAGGRLINGPFDIRIGKCAVLLDPWDNPLVILDNSAGLVKVDGEKNIIGNQPTVGDDDR